MIKLPHFYFNVPEADAPQAPRQPQQPPSHAGTGQPADPLMSEMIASYYYSRDGAERLQYTYVGRTDSGLIYALPNPAPVPTPTKIAMLIDSSGAGSGGGGWCACGCAECSSSFWSKTRSCDARSAFNSRCRMRRTLSGSSASSSSLSDSSVQRADVSLVADPADPPLVPKRESVAESIPLAADPPAPKDQR